MANPVAWARSNYFAVKDVEKFREWADKRYCVVWEGSRQEQGLFAITPHDNDCGNWEWIDPETDEEFDILEELAEHLVDGHVAILMEISHTKLAYVGGNACAINSKGKRIDIALGHIYEQAKTLGEHITVAEE